MDLDEAGQRYDADVGDRHDAVVAWVLLADAEAGSRLRHLSNDRRYNLYSTPTFRLDRRRLRLTSSLARVA
jgi:hypothetical protein